MAGNYEKALAARKLLNVKDMYSNRHLYGGTTQLLAQIEKLWRKRLSSSLERIIEAKSNKYINNSTVSSLSSKAPLSHDQASLLL
jgi:hypothetical protein